MLPSLWPLNTQCEVSAYLTLESDPLCALRSDYLTHCVHSGVTA